jgi:hypothetical protein
MQLEAAINAHYPKPGIRVLRVRDRIALVQVLDGEMLTQRMGSTGSAAYIAMVVCTLTSLEDVSHVYLSGFEEGDHAGPGCFSRADLLDFFGWLREKVKTSAPSGGAGR